MLSEKSVSVVIPVLNEGEHIKDCLDSLLAQDYNNIGNIEILVVDGSSADKSKQIVKDFMSDNRISVKALQNINRITSSGLNIGIKEANGGYIVLLSGHASLDKSYISSCMNKLKEKNSDCVGGKVAILSDNFIKKAIAIARSSLIGGSILPHRYSNRGCFVRTVAYGLYKKEIFEKTGLFDEKLICDQDEEFNWRLIKNGFKIYFNPEAKSYYRQKRNIFGLAQQLFRTGFWKAKTQKKHPDFFKISFIIPSLFILSLVLFFVMGLFYKSSFYIFIGELAAYVSTILLFSLLSALQNGFNYFLILPLIYLVIHFSIGFGFLAGILEGKIYNKNAAFN